MFQTYLRGLICKRTFELIKVGILSSCPDFRTGFFVCLFVWGFFSLLIVVFCFVLFFVGFWLFCFFTE